MSELQIILTPILRENLKKAYKTNLILEENEEDEKAEDILEQCDDIYYENEEQINHLLEQYANELEI